MAFREIRSCRTGIYADVECHGELPIRICPDFVKALLICDNISSSVVDFGNYRSNLVDVRHPSLFASQSLKLLDHVFHCNEEGFKTGSVKSGRDVTKFAAQRLLVSTAAERNSMCNRSTANKQKARSAFAQSWTNKSSGCDFVIRVEWIILLRAYLWRSPVQSNLIVCHVIYRCSDWYLKCTVLSGIDLRGADDLTLWVRSNRIDLGLRVRPG